MVLLQVHTHYHKLASSYDTFHLPKIRATVEHVIPHLQLNADDVLADIGGGTGALSNLIWSQGVLKNPVLCVDPSSEMLKKAAALEGVEPVLATAVDFITPDCMAKYGVTKIFCAYAIHHIPNAMEVLHEICNVMPAGGISVIVTRFNPTLPYFSKAYDVFMNETVTQLSIKFLQFSPKISHVKANIVKVSIPYEMTKGEWYAALQSRYQSHLLSFTDEEIEEGIQELEKTKFNTVKDTDIITIEDELTLLILTKKK